MVVGVALPIEVGKAVSAGIKSPFDVVTDAALVAIYAAAVHWMVKSVPPPRVKGTAVERFVFEAVVAAMTPRYRSPACDCGA